MFHFHHFKNEINIDVPETGDNIVTQKLKDIETKWEKF